MNKAELAAELFGKGRNCSQAVLCAYAPDCDMDENRALALSVGFGGGIGRTGEICGALSGAIMALGLKSGFTKEDGREKMLTIYEQVRCLLNSFAEINGSVKCAELLKCDLKSSEGQKFYKDHNLRERCGGFVRLASELLEAL